MRFITLILALCFGFIYAKASGQFFPNETLNYVISYKWGLIHKDAGEASLSLSRKGSEYQVMLTAKTKPWADKVYQVRDTLKGRIQIKGLKPLMYIKATHEKGKRSLDEINYLESGNTTTGIVKRTRWKDGKENVTEKKLTCTGPVYDMLSVFYYLRILDYSQLNANKIYTTTLFSGSKKEKLRIRSLGEEIIKLKDGTRCNAYHIKFNFTQEGGRKSSDDIDTWISTDGKHIPLYLVGRLPIGEVRAYFISSDRQ